MHKFVENEPHVHKYVEISKMLIYDRSVTYVSIIVKTKHEKENLDMRKTKTAETNNKVSVNAETLSKILDCGRPTAMKIGEAAGARFQIGKRVLYKMDKIEKYLDGIAEQEAEKNGVM